MNVMNVNTESQERRKDILLWSLVFIILTAVVVGNSLYHDLSVVVRALCGVVAVIVASFLALRTTKGQATLVFARESRIEIRKVVWPTRAETIQTTLVVFVFTAVTGLLLLMLDGVFVWLVSLFTGVRG